MFDLILNGVFDRIIFSTCLIHSHQDQWLAPMDTKHLHLRKGTIVEDVEEAIKNLKVMAVSEEPKALKEAE